MQNLTVVPGHWDENRAHHEEGYTLIIGHRRFAAGKMAGVTMYPCRIVQDMSYKDQVGTMLEENMQRIDLTVLEQAEGFQMMLDLGYGRTDCRKDRILQDNRPQEVGDREA